MMTHKTAPTPMMAVLISAGCVGASSRLSQPTQSESIGRASTNVAPIRLFLGRTLDDCDRGRAHAEKIDIRIFDFDPNRKALRDSDPVQFAFHVRHTRRRQIDFAFGLHGPSDSLNLSAEALVRCG